MTNFHLQVVYLYVKWLIIRYLMEGGWGATKAKLKQLLLTIYILDPRPPKIISWLK